MPRRSGLARLAGALAGAVLVGGVVAGSARAQAAGAQATAARGGAAAREAAAVRLARFVARFPQSRARPAALLQLAEVRVWQADAAFAAAPAAGAPDYAVPIAHLEELTRAYPEFARLDAARYTLGTLYASQRRHADAARLFERVAAAGVLQYAADAQFRLGDARFELAAQAGAAERRALYASAAEAYERAATAAGDASDLRLLALYKLGWAYYNAAAPGDSAAYERALVAFGRLVDSYDRLDAEQQARLGLRGEALEYMAVAFTRAGGAEAAGRYFLRGGVGGAGRDKLAMLRRVARSLREQGDVAGAVRAYRVLRSEAPNDSGALAAQEAIVALAEQPRGHPDSAQAARLVLVSDFAPRTMWANANPALAERAAKARLEALQRSAQYALARAQGGDAAAYPQAAELYGRLGAEFFGTPASRAARVLYAEALLGQGRHAEAGAAYARAAATILSETRGRDSAGREAAEQAARNAVVAYDSAVARAPAERALQDSLFGAIDRLVAAFPRGASARGALLQKGRRAAAAARWDAMAEAFGAYAARYPDDDYAPTAAKLVGDALFRQEKYADAQRQWTAAGALARRRGRTALADSVEAVRRAAATAFADTLIRRGEHRRAAEEVYVAFADAAPQGAQAPDALRDAIETYLLAAGRPGAAPGATATPARARAIELATRLVRDYPRYRYRAQYQTLRAQLLAEAGRRDEAIAALRELVKESAGTAAAAEPRLRLAVALDSAGQGAAAAAAYEEFSAAHRGDPRAADALYNAAVAYREARRAADAARAYAAFADAFPRDPRAGPARLARLALLRQGGDSAGARREFARLCEQPTSAAVRAECADAAARRAFELGLATFARYQPERLVIETRAALNAAGVARASARKQALLRESVAHFEDAIRAGSAEYVAAASYYVGLAQYEYGEFLKNVALPATLNEGERVAALNGAAAQAAEYHRAAERSWQALVEKAAREPTLAASAAARPWLDRARATIRGQIDRAPQGGAGSRP